jgi:phospholipid transport system substrate-binding protein
VRARFARTLLLLLLLLLAASAGLSPAGAVAASGPTEQLKAVVDRVIGELENKKIGEAERRRRIRRVADEIFDFEDMARRALAQHWRTLTPAQQAEFVPLFSDLLERTYLSTIERYNGEPVQFTGQRIDGEQATVFTHITTKQGQDVPVDYRMQLKGDRWLIYDVNIEGIGLVANYRSQFHSIMTTSSYDALVKRIRARIQELDKPPR